MDLSKMKNDRKLYLSKWYFYAGFLCLPFLWIVNAFWFFKEAFQVQPYEEQRQIKRYVIQSAIGASVWIAGLVAWAVVFQIKRSSWGELGDDLSFIIPLGRS